MKPLILPPPETTRGVRQSVIVIALALGLIALALIANTLLMIMAASAAPAPYRLSGDEVAIYDLAGHVTLEGGGTRAVEVTATFGGRDADRLRVESGPVRGRPSLRVIFPSNRIVMPGLGWGTVDHLWVDDDGTFGDRGNHGGWFLGGRRVSISGRGGGLEAWADLVVRVPRGQRVRLYHGAGEIEVSNVDGDLRLNGHSGGVAVNGMKGSLLVDVGSGRVEVRDAEGDVSVDTGSGGVTLVRVHGRRILADTGSGGVEGDDLRADRLHVDTGSGRVRLSGVRAPRIDLDTGSGGVELALEDDVESLLVDTGSGSVVLRVPEHLGAAIDVDTGSGPIHSEVPMVLRRYSHDHLTGSLGDGRGRIVIDTGSGGVRILGS